jgi:hypothetical protein
MCSPFHITGITIAPVQDVEYMIQDTSVESETAKLDVVPGQFHYVSTGLNLWGRAPQISVLFNTLGSPGPHFLPIIYCGGGSRHVYLDRVDYDFDRKNIRRMGRIMNCAKSLRPNSSVLRAFAFRGHLDQFWIKPCDNFHEVGLSRHDRLNILVCHRHFVEARRN